MKSANVGLPPRKDRHETVLPRVVEALRAATRVLCVIHAGPDGDAAGATLGLGLALRELGKDVTFFCQTGVPYNLQFLPGLEHVVDRVPDDMTFDATAVCDVSTFARIGPGLPPKERLGTLLNIDHHVTNEDFGDINYVDAGAAAVGVMIVRILDGLAHPLSKDVSTALYTSVLTDTGSFRYSSANPEAFVVAGRCVAAGANPWDVSSEIYEQNPLERLELLRDVLETLKVSDDGRVATLVVTRPMLERAQGRTDLTAGFINYARSIRGVEVACLATEPLAGSKEPWTLSFRSRGRVNVARVAAKFEGGGHHNAAGGRFHGYLDGLRVAVAKAVQDEFDALASAS